MSKFSFDAIETLDYDFTQIPAEHGKGKCKGYGTIPEPSQARIDLYAKAVKELYKVDAASDVAEAVDVEAANKEKAETFLNLTAELCQQSPSKAELEELPPRYARAFLKWVFANLADPKVLTGDTPN